MVKRIKQDVGTNKYKVALKTCIEENNFVKY